jgi:hypothetical protein
VATHQHPTSNKNNHSFVVETPFPRSQTDNDAAEQRPQFREAATMLAGFGASSFGVVSAGDGKLKCWLCHTRQGPWPVDPFKLDLSCRIRVDYNGYASSHFDNVNRFIGGSEHSREQRNDVSEWFKPHISELKLPDDRKEMQLLFYAYILSTNTKSPKILRGALGLLAWFKKMESIVAFMLGAWKNLAQSRAHEQKLTGVEFKDVSMLVHAYNQRRNDWKEYKRTVFDAGELHLVEQLVRPFWGVSPSAKPVVMS